jgi:uncharacterized phage-associated protein
MVDVLEVTHYIKTDSPIANDWMNNVKLMKLIYYVQAWTLAWTGKTMFEEPIEAWVQGPVVDKVWQHQAHGRYDIPARSLDDEQIAITNAVIGYYGHMSGSELGELTHTVVGSTPTSDDIYAVVHQQLAQWQDALTLLADR